MVNTWVIFLKFGNLINVTVNPSSPNSDENEISLYIITTCSNIQMMRIKEMIAKGKMSWYLEKFSLLVP